eukprot:1157858-Pelagomonas_calceolata.AAC.1
MGACARWTCLLLGTSSSLLLWGPPTCDLFTYTDTLQSCITSCAETQHGTRMPATCADSMGSTFMTLLPCLWTQLGHRASECTSGTVNWRQIYGDNAFILRPPVYWSEELAAKKARQPDAGILEKQAREYAKV